MTDPRLARLAQLAALLRDHRVADLAAAAARLSALEQRLTALEAHPPAQPTPAEALVALRHAAWAARQRQRIEGERPPLLAARDAAAAQARVAVVRADLVARLAGKGGRQLS